MRPLRAWLWLLLAGLLCASPARAEQPHGQPPHAEQLLDVAKPIRGVPLGARMELFEDPLGKFSITEVSRFAARSFRRATSEAPSLGFTNSVYWLRVEVDNTSLQKRAWLLEISYPHLDDLILYVPSANGTFTARRSGDMQPFEQRDLAYRNFVYTLEEEPGQRRTYYLRVHTSGSMTLPLVAWTLEEFIQHQHLDWAGLCIFYGVLLVMTLYHGFMALFTRQFEHLCFALAVLSMGFFQMTYVGHSFQFLFPHDPALAQLCMPLSIGLCVTATSWFGERQMVGNIGTSALTRFNRAFTFYSLTLTGASLFLPFSTAIRLLAASTVLITTVVSVGTLRMVIRRVPGVGMHALGWGFLLFGALVLSLKTANVLPTNLFTQWSLQIGATAMFVVVSSAMASRLTLLRSELDQLNSKLSRKVTALEQAVQRAEQASGLAERATRVKDEFMATMSHELRTPLNTIINIPQGLVEDFPLSQRATCRACQSEFELEPNESVDAATACPECHKFGSLVPHERVVYIGQGEKTARYLEKIERSGKHLLHVIDGMLRADQNDSHEIPLVLESTDLALLTRELVEEMSDLSERAGVALSLGELPEQLQLSVDPLRIRQILINLIGNAIKFSPRGAHVRVALTRAEGGCVCSVQDEGIGIAEDKLETVFASYQQADAGVARNYGGTGLGLSIARSLVRMHGGELWVESKLGQGSTFSFRLPGGESVRQSA